MTDVPATAAGRRRVQVDGGPVFEMAGDEDSLLRGALRAGIAWPYECSVGGCGTCRFELLDGVIEDVWPGAPGLSARERQRGRRLACQSRVAGDLRVRVRIDPPAVDELAPRRFDARLVAVRSLTHDLSEFTFASTGPAAFRPGQYALVRLPGVTGARAYSMSNLPNADGSWSFIVRRVPGGRGSAALFDGLAGGAVVTLDGPYGHAGFRPETARDVVCIGGGSGVGAMLSVTRAALAAGFGGRVHLFVGMRSQDDLGIEAAMTGLGAPEVAVHVVLSEPRSELGWSGASGWVHDEVERRIGAAVDHADFYAAGPPAMITALQRLLLLTHRVPPDRLRYDRFV